MVLFGLEGVVPSIKTERRLVNINKYLVSIETMQSTIGFVFVNYPPRSKQVYRRILNDIMKHFGFKNNKEYIDAYPGQMSAKRSKICSELWKDCSVYSNEEDQPYDLFSFGHFVVYFKEGVHSIDDAINNINYWYGTGLEDFNGEGAATIPISVKDVVDAMDEDEVWDPPEEKYLWFCEDWRENEDNVRRVLLSRN